MPIKEVTFYRVACDNCGKEADYGEYSAWAQPEGATEMLGDDWHVAEDKFYCSDCVTWDDETDDLVVKAG